MVNRISTSGKYSQLVADMQKQLSNYNKLTKQLASGSKLTSITDDPIATVDVLNTNRQLGQMDTFLSFFVIIVLLTTVYVSAGKILIFLMQSPPTKYNIINVKKKKEFLS